MGRLFLGIDTSNYTTSLSITDLDNNIIWEERIVLKVKDGNRGLRQSEALFQHISNMPILIGHIPTHINKNNIVAIGYSNQPRPLEGSYMPVFLAGDITAMALASLKSLPVYSFSHQEGHIAAATSKHSLIDDFIGLHLSGGTTEILSIKKRETPYIIDIIGGTKDISVGQLVDRTGVKLGLPFPAGKHIDQMALEYTESRYEKLPEIKLNDLYFNISGIENQIDSLISNETNPREICYSLMMLISSLMGKIIQSFDVSTPILLFGGVASSVFLRNQLNNNDLSKHRSIIFGEPNLSVDNSVGISILTKEKYLEDIL